MSQKLMSLGLGALAGLAMLGSGCGGGASRVVIIIHNGHYGYYSGAYWCDYTNNYCGTGVSYGISDNGCYYNGSYCSGGYSGGYSGGSTGGSTGGSYGGSTGGSTGGSYGGSTGSGSTGGTVSTGGGSTGSGSTGSTSGGYTGGSTGSGSTGSTSGGYTGSGGGSTGSGSTGSTSGGYTGSGGGSTGSGSTGSTSGGYTASGGSSGSSGSGSSGTSGYSTDTGTKDVDLQRAALQQQDLDNRANTLAGQYQMNFEAARQLTQLADQMQQLSAQGQMTDLDRDALARSALGVVGVSPDDVQAAMVRATKDGDKTALNGLLDKAASNLGMTSSAALRDQILPSLGININN